MDCNPWPELLRKPIFESDSILCRAFWASTLVWGVYCTVVPGRNAQSSMKATCPLLSVEMTAEFSGLQRFAGFNWRMAGMKVQGLIVSRGLGFYAFGETCYVIFRGDCRALG